jgi:cytochrome b6-f complex iron-sulfur subunit
MQNPEPDPDLRNRRKIIWAAILGSLAIVGTFAYVVIGFFLRPFLPRRGPEKPSWIIPIGRASDFASGVSTKFLNEHRICVVKNDERLFVIYARCTHLGCIPDWQLSEKRFKCPCHKSAFCMGSQFDGEGRNCDGPAQRPLDRVHIEVAPDGLLAADTSRLYQWPKDGENQFNSPGAYIEV